MTLTWEEFQKQAGASLGAPAVATVAPHCPHCGAIMRPTESPLPALATHSPRPPAWKCPNDGTLVAS